MGTVEVQTPMGGLMTADTLRKRARYLLEFFVVALIVSGLTAVPLKWEIDILQSTIGEGTFMDRLWPAMARWISFVHQGLAEIDQEYRFMFYGTDWLAFGHVVIAISFLGPLRDPVKNLWVIESGMIACVLVIPVAMIFGPIRGIPFFWRLLDCSFGVFGIIPLWMSRNYVRRIIVLEQGGAGISSR
jgi:hypothetical protein